MVDFAGVLARLKQGGFTAGPLIVETLIAGDRNHLLAAATDSRRFLQKLVVRS